MVSPADTDTVAEPRRSGRIAARSASVQPSAPVETKATKAKAPRGGKKKKVVEEAKEESSAEEEDEAEPESTSKKAKSGGDDVQLSPIGVGDSLPMLVLKDEKGDDVQVGELAEECGVVLFLVPKADTPGCTTQACGYRDVYPEFTEREYVVYCLSADSPTAQSKWQKKKELPYPLISDPKRVLITALGAGEGGKTKRSHFVFEKGGKLVDKVLPVKPADSPRLALEFIKANQK